AYPGERVVLVGAAILPRTGNDFALARYVLTAAPPPAQVVSRGVFYNRSTYDGNDPGINGLQDLLALAPDKQALLPGQTATFANVTSYARGINGVYLRLNQELSSITPDDFMFKVGNGVPGGTWAVAPAHTSFATIPAGNAPGTHVLFTWADGAIKNQWLQVTVLANDHTKLAAP